MTSESSAGTVGKVATIKNSVQNLSMNSYNIVMSVRYLELVMTPLFVQVRLKDVKTAIPMVTQVSHVMKTKDSAQSVRSFGVDSNPLQVRVCTEDQSQ